MIAVQAKAKPTRAKDDASSLGKASAGAASLPAKERSSALASVISGGSARGAEGLQAKIAFGGPRDPFEREADQVADRVAMNASVPQISSIPSGGLSSSFQKKDSEGSAQTKASRGRRPRRASTIAAAALLQRGAGKPLSEGTRAALEGAMGADLGGVRVHDDGSARAAAQGIGARAFTNRSDIFLGPGESDRDVKLMAHEATHVVQQGAARQRGAAGSSAAAIQRKPASGGEEPIQRSAAERGEEMVQADLLDDIGDLAGDAWDATGGAAIDLAGDAVDAVVELGADAFWAVIDRVAPFLAPIIRGISEKGIFGYLKEKILAGMGSIFAALQNQGGLLAALAERFVSIGQKAAAFMELLSAFCCETLFAAIGEMKSAISDMAGDAWNAVVEFFQPIGDFFKDLWDSYGAPVLDWLKKTGNEAWEFIKDLGATIWSYAQPIKDALSAAWDWVMEQLGLGDSEGSSEGGLIGWVTEKAQSAWDAIKETLNPIIEPIKGVVARVAEVLPLQAIMNLRETVTGWLDSITAVASNMEGEDGVVKNQAGLRERILPAIVASIGTLQASVAAAGAWIVSKLQGMANVAIWLIDAIASNSVIGFAAGAISWVKEKAIELSGWAIGAVNGVFLLASLGLERLKGYLRPLLDFLVGLFEAMSDIAGKIGEFVMGALFGWIPKCIREPIKNFILEQIIGRIPIFKELLRLPDIWERAKTVALTILTQIFVDGNLLGALWTFFKELLNLIGLPAKLVVSIVRKAAQALGDILKNPIRFLLTLLKSVKQGLSQFFGNFLKHMFDGFVDWLFGSLTEAGIKLPKDWSLGSILALVLDVLGITMEKVWKKIEAKIGADKVEKLKKMLSIATGVWGFVKVLVEKGPAGLWEEIKSQISNLWNTVIDAAISWISEKIIAEVTAKLLTMLDPSGIMAVVNSCIAIYRAIESAVQYAKKILQFVDRVLDGIGEIAQGIFATGANVLENSLAKAIPIAIGFLANQVGLGNLSQRIKEVIAKVQETVDKAFDWLVDKAWAAGKWIVDKIASGAAAVKEGVASLLEWWKRKKPFKMGGEDHSLYFTGQWESAQLVMRSVERPLDAYVKIIRDNVEADAALQSGSGASQKAGYIAALDAIDVQQTAIRAIKVKTYQSKDGPKEYANYFSEKEGEDIANAMGEIARLLSTIPSKYIGDSSVAWVPPSEVSYPSQRKASGRFGANTSDPIALDSTDGQTMIANTLSMVPGKGTEGKIVAGSGASPRGYSALFNALFTLRGKYVKPGHLLNHHLYGTGDDSKNLAPITASANSMMESKVEGAIKRHILEDNGVAKYEVQVHYDRSLDDPAHGKYQIDRLMPSKVQMRWWKLKLKEGVTSEEEAKNRANWTEGEGVEEDADCLPFLEEASPDESQSAIIIKFIGESGEADYAEIAAHIGRDQNHARAVLSKHPQFIQTSQPIELLDPSYSAGYNAYARALIDTLESAPGQRYSDQSEFVAQAKKLASDALDNKFNASSFRNTLARLREKRVISEASRVVATLTTPEGINKYNALRGSSDASE